MSQSSSDYSKLIEAILQDDRRAADILASDLLKRVILFLRIRMGAPPSVAEECAYQAFSEVFEKIKNDKITEKKAIFKYFITASKHEYLRLRKKEEKNDSDFSLKEATFPAPADQLKNLIDKERQNMLKKCLNKLTEIKRRFILTFFTHKSVDLAKVAHSFNYSYAKTRTLKTRIMQELQDCIQKNK